MKSSRNPSYNNLGVQNSKKLDKISKSYYNNNLNNNNFHSKNKIYFFNNFENIENAVNKYSIKLFEKLNSNNFKKKPLKPYDLAYNLNNNINLFTKSMNKQTKEMIKTIKIKKNKEKKDNNKFQKEINIDCNIDSKNKNRNNLSSSYSNTKNANNNENEPYGRKYSDNTRRKNDELNKIKDIKVQRNFSNITSNINNIQIDLNKKDNVNNIHRKKYNMLKLENNSNNNYNNKYTIDLKNKNNSRKNTTTNKSNNNNNELITINSYNSKDKEKNENKVNNNIEKEKKFSIVDIPAPSNNDSNNILIKIDEKRNTNLYKNLNLSIKEKAYLSLSKSHILPLHHQIIFSRSTNNVKKLITKKDILKNYELFLKNKINDYEKKIILYNEKIKSVFAPTKIAEITLNFITNYKEIEFKDNYDKLIYDKKDYNFKYYKNYIKILYYIINEKNVEKISDENLLSNLYKILEKKGYKNIKDYIYFLFISSKNVKKENYFMENMDKIDDIINNEVPKLLDFHESTKMCKFIGFSLFLIKEIIDFGNIIKNTTNLEIETKNFIEELRVCLNKFRSKFIS